MCGERERVASVPSGSGWWGVMREEGGRVWVAGCREMEVWVRAQRGRVGGARGGC